jgi:hypothetical protein
MPEQKVIEIRNPKELTGNEIPKQSKKRRLRGGLADRDLTKSNVQEPPSDEFATRKRQFFGV